MLSLIAAMANNNVIGYQQRMPWHLPRELQHFKRVTHKKPVIMGRHTYESIGHALPERRNLVVSRQHSLTLPDADVFSTIEQAIAACHDATETMIIGGAQLYQQTIEQADRLYLTLIELETAGDAFFPAWNPSQWGMKDTQAFQPDLKNPHPYRCITLDKKTQPIVL